MSNRIGGDTNNSCHLYNKKIFQVVFTSELFEHKVAPY